MYSSPVFARFGGGPTSLSCLHLADWRTSVTLAGSNGTFPMRRNCCTVPEFKSPKGTPPSQFSPPYNLYLCDMIYHRVSLVTIQCKTNRETVRHANPHETRNNPSCRCSRSFARPEHGAESIGVRHSAAWSRFWPGWNPWAWRALETRCASHPVQPLAAVLATVPCNLPSLLILVWRTRLPLQRTALVS
jgi:hypothetical protein